MYFVLQSWCNFYTKIHSIQERAGVERIFPLVSPEEEVLENCFHLGLVFYKQNWIGVL